MQKFIVFSGLFCAGLFLATSPVLAASTTISNSSTSAQSLSGGDSLTVTSSGTLTISGSTVAVALKGSSSSLITVNNSGTINQTGTGRAIRDNVGGLTVSITNSGTIESHGDDTYQMNVAGSTVTLTNTGTIEALGTGGSNGQAIDWNALTGTANTLNNNAGGVITAADSDAVRPGVNGIVNNDGRIQSSTPTPATNNDSNDGIDVQDNTNITITNAKANLVANANLIEGARHGITGGDPTVNITMSVTNNSHGTIKGDDGSGINVDGNGASEVVTINNAGMIIGNGVTGDGDGVDVDGLVILTNSGTILSKDSHADTSEGVTVGGGTIINSGTIEGSVTTGGAASGSVGRGITLAGVDKDSSGNSIALQKIYANTTVTNNAGGLIKGDSNAGIAIAGVTGATNFSVTITNNAGGTIEGNSSSVAVIDGTAAVAGTITPAASVNNETVINYGTIQQDSTGKAISLGSGTNSVQILGGAASINGDISGGTTAGSNTLTIDPNSVTTGQSFSYSHVLSNFSSVNLKSGTITLSGESTYSGSTTVSGGKAYINNDPSAGSGTGSGNVTVQSSGTLAGSGKVSGAVTVQSGGTLASGAAQTSDATHDTVTGTGLTLSSNLSVNGAASLTFDLGAGAGGSTFASPNTNSTFLTANGLVTFATSGGAINIGLVDLTAFSTTATLQLRTQSPYLLISAGGLDSNYNLVTTGGYDQNGYVLGIGSAATGNEVLNTVSLSALDINGGALEAPYNNLRLYLNNGNLEVVPEPGTWALMLGGLACLIFIQSRRRRLQS